MRTCTAFRVRRSSASASWPPPVARHPPSWFHLQPVSSSHRHRRRHPVGRHRPRAGRRMRSPLVRGERILCAGAAGECPVPQGARVIDAQGQYLIPGLIDSHVHLLFLQNGSAGEELGLDLRDLLAQGVTTVRDMGTEPGGPARARRERFRVAAGLRDAARRRPPILLQRRQAARATRTRGVELPPAARDDDAVAGLDPDPVHRGRRPRLRRARRRGTPGRWASSCTPSSTASRSGG